MNGPELVSHARDQLAASLATRAAPTPAPLTISPWLAMALLQKAIRRGREDLALQAAATLLRDGPDRLWRRCGAIAFEDIGVADLDTVALVTAALAGKGWRARLGGEWAVASLVVSRMADAPKCRAADDLLMGVERHPALTEARGELAFLPTSELLGIATGQGRLPERALALWYALGTARRPSHHLQPRRGDPQAVFDHLCDRGYPDSVVEVAREGYRKVGEVLCPFVSLLCPLRRGQPAHIVDDELPPETPIGDVPSWAFDMFVREGRQAIKLFLLEEAPSTQWVREHVPGPRRVEFLGNILFAAEGGLLRSRLDWPTGAALRRFSEREAQGSGCVDAAEIIQLLRADLPRLNRVRTRVG